MMTKDELLDKIISIHAAQEGCDLEAVKIRGVKKISIHAAQEGCDHLLLRMFHQYVYFNPRSPSGLRQVRRKNRRSHLDFNPRSPSGLRLSMLLLPQLNRRFQSTQPEWAATSAA